MANSWFPFCGEVCIGMAMQCKPLIISAPTVFLRFYRCKQRIGVIVPAVGDNGLVY